MLVVPEMIARTGQVNAIRYGMYGLWRYFRTQRTLAEDECSRAIPQLGGFGWRKSLQRKF